MTVDRRPWPRPPCSWPPWVAPLTPAAPAAVRRPRPTARQTQARPLFTNARESAPLSAPSPSFPPPPLPLQHCRGGTGNKAAAHWALCIHSFIHSTRSYLATGHTGLDTAPLSEASPVSDFAGLTAPRMPGCAAPLRGEPLTPSSPAQGWSGDSRPIQSDSGCPAPKSDRLTARFRWGS